MNIRVKVFGKDIGTVCYPDYEQLQREQLEWRKIALQIMRATAADHVVYCTVLYNEDMTPMEIHYMTEPMDDDHGEFDNWVTTLTRNWDNVFIGAVHN